MITYNWNFNPLTCYTQHEGQSDVVMTVHWQYSASKTVGEQTYTTQSIGTVSLPFDSSSDTFIPFGELTKETVQSWVEASLGEEHITKMQESLATQLEEQITPKIVNHIAPWDTNNAFRTE